MQGRRPSLNSDMRGSFELTAIEERSDSSINLLGSSSPPPPSAQPPPPPLARLPGGLQPQPGGAWGNRVAEGLVSQICWSMTIRAFMLGSIFALVIVIMREPPVSDPPLLERASIEGHQALAEFIPMPKQYNRTEEFGSRKPIPPAEGTPLHTTVLLANADTEFPSLYLGHPAEPRLTPKGMVDAFVLGGAIRSRLVQQGLLSEAPSPTETIASSIADGRAIDTANAFLLGLLPVRVGDLRKQPSLEPDCHCRREPNEIHFGRKRPANGRGMDADVLGRHSASPVKCLAACMGVELATITGPGVTQDTDHQPVPLQVSEPHLDVVHRQFDVCRSGINEITHATRSSEWADAEKHRFGDLLNTIRQLRTPEVCVASIGAQSCKGMRLSDLPVLHDVLRAHAVQDETWKKDPGIDRQHLAYEVFVAAEWSQHQMFQESRGSALGGILLGSVLHWWHSILTSLDSTYEDSVVSRAFSTEGRQFERWSKLLLHQGQEASKEQVDDTRVHFHSVHRWQLLALLAALQAEDGIPLPEDLSRVSLTLRSTQGSRKSIKSKGLKPDKLLVELEYCVNADQCRRLSLKDCPSGVCSLHDFQDRLVTDGVAKPNPYHSDDQGKWSEEMMNPDKCNLLLSRLISAEQDPEGSPEALSSRRGPIIAELQGSRRY